MVVHAVWGDVSSVKSQEADTHDTTKRCTSLQVEEEQARLKEEEKQRRKVTEQTPSGKMQRQIIFADGVHESSRPRREGAEAAVFDQEPSSLGTKNGGAAAKAGGVSSVGGRAEEPEDEAEVAESDTSMEETRDYMTRNKKFSKETQDKIADVRQTKTLLGEKTGYMTGPGSSVEKKKKKTLFSESALDVDAADHAEQEDDFFEKNYRSNVVPVMEQVVWSARSRSSFDQSGRSSPQLSARRLQTFQNDNIERAVDKVRAVNVVVLEGLQTVRPTPVTPVGRTHTSVTPPIGCRRRYN